MVQKYVSDARFQKNVRWIVHVSTFDSHSFVQVSISLLGLFLLFFEFFFFLIVVSFQIVVQKNLFFSFTKYNYNKI